MLFIRIKYIFKINLLTFAVDMQASTPQTTGFTMSVWMNPYSLADSRVWERQYDNMVIPLITND